MRWSLARQTFVLLIAKVAIICAMQKKFHDFPTESGMATTPWAEVYVINLKDRTDKCRCMRQQLRDAPWPTHRFDAVNMNNTAASCPTLTLPAIEDETKAKKSAALVCSNLHIWRKFLNESTASHLVVFEDDAILPDPRMWDKLQQLIQEPCMEWDYLMIDGFGPGTRATKGWYGSTDTTPTLCSNNMTWTNLSFRVSGSQMQVMNRHAVEVLVYYADRIGRPDMRGMAFTPVMDKYVAYMMQNQEKGHIRKDPVKAFAVTAGLAPQARFYHPDEMDTGVECADTVWTTDDRRNQFVIGHRMKPAMFPCSSN